MQILSDVSKYAKSVFNLKSMRLFVVINQYAIQIGLEGIVDLVVVMRILLFLPGKMPAGRFPISRRKQKTYSFSRVLMYTRCSGQSKMTGSNPVAQIGWI